MDSRDTLPAFSLLLDGRLSDKEARDTQSQIAADPQLAESYQQFKEVRDVVRAGSALANLPQGFDTRLRERLKNAELEQRAHSAALRAGGSESWWHRTALALGGMAAGVAGTLVLNHMGVFGTERVSPGAQQSEALTTRSSAGMTLTSDDIQRLMEPQFDALSDLRNQVEIRDTVDPRWLQLELDGTGLTQRNQRLMQVVNDVTTADAKPYAKMLFSMNSACLQLESMSKDALFANTSLKSDDVVYTLNSAFPTANAEIAALGFTWSHGATGITLPTAQQDLPLKTYSYAAPRAQDGTTDPEFNRYAAARTAYVAKDYTTALGMFREYLTEYSLGHYSDCATQYACRAMLAQGDDAGARDLLEAYSRRKPEVLALLKKDEVDRMCRAPDNADPLPSVTWWTEAGGNARLLFGRTQIAKAVSPIAAVKPVNANEVLRQRALRVQVEQENKAKAQGIRNVSPTQQR